jgi:hypothetical protein
MLIFSVLESTKDDNGFRTDRVWLFWIVSNWSNSLNMQQRNKNTTGPPRAHFMDTTECTSLLQWFVSELLWMSRRIVNGSSVTPLEARLLGMTLATTTQLSDYRYSQPTVFTLLLGKFLPLNSDLCVLLTRTNYLPRSLSCICNVKIMPIRLSVHMFSSPTDLNEFWYWWVYIKTCQENFLSVLFSETICSSFRVKERFKRK